MVIGFLFFKETLFATIFISYKNGLKHFPEKGSNVVKKSHVQIILIGFKITHPFLIHFIYKKIFLISETKYY